MDRSTDKPSIAFRAGQLLGLGLRGYTAVERRLIIRCVGWGMHPALCRWALRILKLGFVALALYVSFWIAAVLFGLWVFRGIGELGLVPEGFDSDEGWQHGMSGFGYYINGQRIGPRDEHD
ncbi:hypothetical protein ALP94_03919 [Pseudomonas savastanoi pv. glycinea]|uniref:DUF3742 family protein n=1 Tax=Pseudomonas quasicaspiana TaxID=2829821 RepID=UPI000EFE22C3|nr:DUF3742 family protein [Pseudomonas quasicaspiana]MCD5976787.1 DUF3742 family protein [Pseudomonas quasicaspiana]RMQ98680.1 hypothetical protein ALP94_03919 [Pseudomonas savastanoi pv. glycinea]